MVTIYRKILWGRSMKYEPVARFKLPAALAKRLAYKLLFFDRVEVLQRLSVKMKTLFYHSFAYAH